MGNNENSKRLYFLGLQNHCRWWLQPWNEKTLAPWKKSYDQPRQHIKKQIHYLPTKVHLVKAICNLRQPFLPFSISFSWGWSWSLPLVQCHEPPSIVLQALYLTYLILWIYLSLPLYNHKGFDLLYTWMVQWFSLLSSIYVWIWQ